MNPQTPSVQVACPLVGTGHCVHDVPHCSALVSDTHTPSQLWAPVGHVPSQARSSAMHAPLQILLPVGQAGMQETPLQLTVPPVGAVHGVHEVEPQ